MLKPKSDSSPREVFIRGIQKNPAAALLPWSSTAVDVRRLVAETAKVPSELLHITVGGRTLTDEVASEIINGSILHYTVKGSGGMRGGDDGGMRL